MSLIEAIEELEKASDYDSFAEKSLAVFSNVHSNEDLELAKKRAYEIRSRIMEENPQFKSKIEGDKEGAQRRLDARKTRARARITRLQKRAKAVKSSIKKPTPQLDSLDDLIEGHQTKIRTEEEAEKQMNTALLCPICHAPDRGNTVNDEPTCLKCMHTLVPKEDMKKYNRAYRRRWQKRK